MSTTRTDHMKYLPHMDILSSDMLDDVLLYRNAFHNEDYTDRDVRSALQKDDLSPHDFMALLSTAALPFLEKMAQKAKTVTREHFGNSVALFTPVYFANYCENHCVYCGFNSHNNIKRARLTEEELHTECRSIASTGLEEVLMLTGESRRMSDVEYIGKAVKIARSYFRVIGLEIYPVNVAEYKYLHDCGADYVTVFQETYNSGTYEKLHLAGSKRIFPYRFYAQERAILGGMRGVGFAALLGLDDYQRDAVATGIHAALCSVNIRMRKLPSPVRACVRLSITTKSTRKTSMNGAWYKLSAPIASFSPSLPLRFPAVKMHVFAIISSKLRLQKSLPVSASVSARI